MTTSRRMAAAAAAAAVALAATPGAAAAGPAGALRQEVKGVKRSLVALEHAADALDERARAARARRVELEATIVATQTLLRLALDGDAGGLRPALLFGFVTIVRARARLDAVDARVATLRDELRRLDARRDALVDELQGLVRRIRDVKLASQRAPDMPFLVTYSADWEAVSMCESSGRWHIDSTYDGGLQFHPNTWLGFGGGEFARYAWQATKWQQIAIAERVLVVQGPQAWPNCFRTLPFHF